MMWRRDWFCYIHNKYHINILNQEDSSKKENGQLPGALKKERIDY
jgi:hypothetical protein